MLGPRPIFPLALSRKLLLLWDLPQANQRLPRLLQRDGTDVTYGWDSGSQRISVVGGAVDEDRGEQALLIERIDPARAISRMARNRATAAPGRPVRQTEAPRRERSSGRAPRRSFSQAIISATVTCGVSSCKQIVGAGGCDGLAGEPQQFQQVHGSGIRRRLVVLGRRRLKLRDRSFGPGGAGDLQLLMQETPRLGGPGHGRVTGGPAPGGGRARAPRSPDRAAAAGGT